MQQRHKAFARDGNGMKVQASLRRFYSPLLLQVKVIVVIEMTVATAATVLIEMTVATVLIMAADFEIVLTATARAARTVC